jgi:glycosyltransferase involved in cell wall biosynthesis
MWKDEAMRRILIFSLAYYPRFVGGAEVAVKEITDRISSDDVEFDMITMRTEPLKVERIGNVTIHRVGFQWKGGTHSFFLYILKYLWMPLALVKALQLHATRRYDATWSIMANYAGAPALFFKLMYREVKLVLTLQEGDPFAHIRKRVGITYPFFKKLFKVADHIQTISKYLADWATEMGATCPITVVPNAVDFDLFSKRGSPAEVAALTVRLGKKPEDIFLITTGRLVLKNAVADIIASLQQLPPQVKLLSLGRGHLETELKNLTTKLKLEDRVIFLDYVPHAELPKYLHVSDIFIRPSLSEGLGNSFLEAMAAGIPVIATPVGGIPDFLTDGETGLFCEVNNPHSIAQKVEKLIKDRESREYIVKNARDMVQKKYAWDQIAGEMTLVLTTGNDG